MILNHCILEKLVIKCDPTDIKIFGPVAKVLDSVHWSSLEHLRFLGDNINSWIQLLAKVEVPRLECLRIWGAESVPQEQTHSSVFVERLVRGSTLADVSFGHVQLKDRKDRVLIVESFDLAVLKNFGQNGGNQDQFQCTKEAVELYKSKIEVQTGKEDSLIDS